MKSKFRNIMFTSFMSKISAFKMNTDPQLKTKVAPFRKDITAKTKAPFNIKAPDITPPSKGKTDRGIII